MAAGQEKVTAGDRIVFLGDSITQAGNGPGGYVELVRQALGKQWGEKVAVIGAGISGNRVPDLERRVDQDVIAQKPTVVVIYIGINDVWHSINGRGTSKEDFQQGLVRLIDKMQAAGARVVLCTASVIGEKTDGSNSLDAMLEEYCEISRKVAAEEQVQLLDLRKAFIDHLKQANADQKEQGILTSDGVHLNAEGNQFVAKQMLIALGAETPHTEKMLRHVVLFRFKEGTSPEDIQKVEEAFAALPGQIPQIADFEWGTDVSVENLADGFTHCFFVSFRSEEDRATYLPHPAHQKFIEIVKPHLDKPFVVDYWTR
jgi:lysophospholipase L1-like esterase